MVRLMRSTHALQITVACKVLDLVTFHERSELRVKELEALVGLEPGRTTRRRLTEHLCKACCGRCRILFLDGNRPRKLTKHIHHCKNVSGAIVLIRDRTHVRQVGLPLSVDTTCIGRIALVVATRWSMQCVRLLGGEECTHFVTCDSNHFCCKRTLIESLHATERASSGCIIIELCERLVYRLLRIGKQQTR